MRDYDTTVVVFVFMNVTWYGTTYKKVNSFKIELKALLLSSNQSDIMTKTFADCLVVLFTLQIIVEMIQTLNN